MLCNLYLLSSPRLCLKTRLFDEFNGYWHCLLSTSTRKLDLIIQYTMEWLRVFQLEENNRLTLIKNSISVMLIVAYDLFYSNFKKFYDVYFIYFLFFIYFGYRKYVTPFVDCIDIPSFWTPLFIYKRSFDKIYLECVMPKKTSCEFTGHVAIGNP